MEFVTARTEKGSQECLIKPREAVQEGIAEQLPRRAGKLAKLTLQPVRLAASTESSCSSWQGFKLRGTSNPPHPVGLRCCCQAPPSKSSHLPTRPGPAIKILYCCAASSPRKRLLRGWHRLSRQRPRKPRQGGGGVGARSQIESDQLATWPTCATTTLSPGPPQTMGSKCRDPKFAEFLAQDCPVGIFRLLMHTTLMVDSALHILRHDSRMTPLGFLSTADIQEDNIFRGVIPLTAQRPSEWPQTCPGPRAGHRPLPQLGQQGGPIRTSTRPQRGTGSCQLR